MLLADIIHMLQVIFSRIFCSTVFCWSDFDIFSIYLQVVMQVFMILSQKIFPRISKYHFPEFRCC